MERYVRLAILVALIVAALRFDRMRPQRLALMVGGIVLVYWVVLLSTSTTLLD